MIGIHSSVKLDEACQEIRDLSARQDADEDRIARLEREVIDLRNVIALMTRPGANAALVSRVERAVEDPAKKVGTILVALSDEMGGSPAEKTLRDALTRFVADSKIRAGYVKLGILGAEEPASTSWLLARRMAEPVAGPNEWGAPVTRRIHKVLDDLGMRPARRAA